MKTTTRAILASAAAATSLAAAHAGGPFVNLTVNATITADNHYALFTGDSSSVALIGHNELGPAGAPGTYNWSKPEPYTFTAGPFIYIAAWSDDNVAQGLLAQIAVGSDTLHSGDPRWQVYPTGTNRGDNDPVPTTGLMTTEITKADLGNLWQVPFVGPGNSASTSPWGLITGITPSAKWMWINTPGDTNPLVGGSGYGEMLIFRTAVPTPGAAALIGLGGLLAARRRR